MYEVKFRGKIVKVPEIGIKWIPIARIKFISDKEEYLCEIIVDSGADITLIPKSFGELLGFSFKGEKIREIRGIGEGVIPYVIKIAVVKIGKYKFNSRIGIALIEEIPLILGRLDIFDQFDIEFKQKTRLTIFRKVK